MLYRYRDIIDENGRMTLEEDAYRVLKVTPSGWWICRDDGELPDNIVAHRLANKRGYDVRFVLSGDGKRFAYPDKQKALYSYRARKCAQVRHADIALKRATLALASIEHLLNVGDTLPKDRWGARILGNPFDFNSPFKVTP